LIPPRLRGVLETAGHGGFSLGFNPPNDGGSSLHYDIDEWVEILHFVQNDDGEGRGFLLPDQVEDRFRRNDRLGESAVNKSNWY
jgi:hypothetical protein